MLFISKEKGQGLVEYALIVALVAVGLIAILLILRNGIGNVFKSEVLFAGRINPDLKVRDLDVPVELRPPAPATIGAEKLVPLWRW